MCTKQAKSGFEAVLKKKCPRCRKGNMFLYSAFNFTKFHKMREQCEVCGQHFEPETGFYWGAMYISYAMSVAVCVTLGIAVNIIFNNPDVNVYIGVIVAAILLLAPFTFQYARVIMLHFVSKIRFNPDAGNL